MDKVKKLYFFLYLFVLLDTSSSVMGQSPANDPNWQLDTAQSDEFNGAYVNPAKWHVLDCPSGDCCNYGGGTSFQKGNAFDSAGKLYLRVDGPGEAPFPCSRRTYATGGIASLYSNYSYGYLEMYAQLPGFVDGGGIGHGDKFWPAFWMYYNPFCSIHNEIDIIDQCCCGYNDTETLTSGWGEAGSGADTCQVLAGGIEAYKNPVSLCTAFHKFAVEWNTNKIIFYRDDVPYFQSYNEPSMTMNPQKIVMDFQISQSCSFYPGMPFPQYMIIDYFHYYKLNLDCGNSVTFTQNSDISGFVYAVKNTITFGNGSNSINLANCGSVNYVFRAVNGFTINGDFTVPLGTQLILAPTTCN